MTSNQFYSSGKSAYNSQLEKDFLSLKKEINQSINLSEKEKAIKISTLEKTFLRKKKRAEYFNF